MGRALIFVVLVLGACARSPRAPVPEPNGAPRRGLLINEVMVDPEPPDREWIELYNAGIDDQPLGGWWIENERGQRFPLANLTLAAESFYLQRFPGDLFGNGAGSIALERCEGPDCIADYVAYDLEESWQSTELHEAALARGEWKGGPFRAGTGVDRGQSIGRDRAARDRNDASDWAGSGGIDSSAPTPQEPNVDVHGAEVH